MRAFAKIKDVKVGDKLEADAGFPCLEPGKPVEVLSSESGDLYVECASGRHSLAGQVEGDHYIGLYKHDG